MFASAGAISQTIFLLLFCCDMQCDGVITHHFLIGGRNATFPKVYLKRLGVVDKLQCFLHCSQYTGCLRVGVSTVGECFLFADSIRTLPDKSVNIGYLYSSLVAGLTTQVSDARQIGQSKATTHASIKSIGTDISDSKATTPPRPTPGDAFIKSVYTIVTQTGTEEDSSTESFVHVDLYGETGGPETLYLENYGEFMREGANDTFTFTRSNDLGKFTKMVLRVFKFGLTPGWLVVGVEVGRKRTYKRHETTDIYYTYINQWFARMDGWHFFETEEAKFVMPYTMVSTFTTEY